MIIHDVCQVIRREAIRFQQHLVIDRIGLELDLSADVVFEFDGLSAWNLKANDV